MLALVLGIVLIEVAVRRLCCETRYPLRRASSLRIPTKHDGQPNEDEETDTSVETVDTLEALVEAIVEAINEVEFDETETEFTELVMTEAVLDVLILVPGETEELLTTIDADEVTGALYDDVKATIETAEVTLVGLETVLQEGDFVAETHPQVVEDEEVLTLQLSTDDEVVDAQTLQRLRAVIRLVVGKTVGR